MVYPIPIEPIDPNSNPTILSLTSNLVLSSTAQFIVRVTPDVAGHTLTIDPDHSHLVQNEGSVSFNLATEGNATATIPAGGEARATWSESGSNHELQISSEGSSLSVDAAMSDSSSNPVQNQIIKAYVDQQIAAVTSNDSTPYIFSSTGHGLGLGDVGKPVARDASGAFEIWNDVSPRDALYLLGDVPDANTIHVYTHAARVANLNNALLPLSWNLFSDGPWLYWDLSAGRYVNSLPSDQYDAGPAIQVMEVGGLNFVAVVRI